MDIASFDKDVSAFHCWILYQGWILMSCLYNKYIYIEDICTYAQIFFHIWGFFHKYIFLSLFLFLFYFAITDYFTLLNRNKECCTLLRIYEWVLQGELRIAIINFFRTSSLKGKSLSLLTETSVKKERDNMWQYEIKDSILVILLYGSWLDLYYRKRLQLFLTSVLSVGRSQLVFLKPRVIECNGN